jgi:short-subunit dehydrogenase
MSNEKVVFITGVSSGIGYQTVLAFARAGYAVAGTARRKEKLQTLAAQVAALPAPHGDFLPLETDVQDENAMQNAFAEVVARCGRIDVVIANAGVGMRGPLLDAAWGDIDTLLQTNIAGVLHTIRAGATALRTTGGGQIITISSVTAQMPMPYSAVYAASKAFVTSLVESLRYEFQDDQIVFSDMLVGRTQTELSEKRLGKAGRNESSGVPVMTAEQVADALVQAAQTRPKQVVLRPFDRLLLIAAKLVPDVIARRVMKQYR